MKEQSTQRMSILLIIIGGLCFIAIGGMAIWADIEAAIFDMARRSSESIPTLKCPAVITTDEIAIVSASFSNPTERDATPLIRTRVTDGYVTLKREYNTRLMLEPGETEIVEIRVDAEDAAYNRLILIRMHQFGYGPFRYRNASCGILILNIPLLTGTQFVVLILVLGGLISALGIYFWIMLTKPGKRDDNSSLHKLLLFICIALLIAISGLFGWWLLGIILFTFWTILGVVLISQRLLESKNNKIIGN